MTAPLVSVVIITWNRKTDVLKAVQSVYEQAYPNFEVVVVDNGSADGTVEELRDAYPEIKLIAFDSNLGVTKGRNAGIERAMGEIIFLLDSDATLDSDALSVAVQKLQADLALGIVAAKCLRAHDRALDDHTWIYSERVKADQDSEFLSYSFCEAGAAIRKAALDRAGLFWEGLFFGGEGDELSLRIWDAGYKILYSPQMVIYHHVSPQMRIGGEQREYYSLRNSLMIYILRYPWWLLLWFLPLKVGVGLVKGIRKNCLRRILQALLEVVRLSPALHRERRPVSSATARRYLGLLRQHGPLSWDLASWFKYKASARRGHRRGRG